MESDFEIYQRTSITSAQKSPKEQHQCVFVKALKYAVVHGTGLAVGDLLVSSLELRLPVCSGRQGS